jgi:hypothetical protein
MHESAFVTGRLITNVVEAFDWAALAGFAYWILRDRVSGHRMLFVLMGFTAFVELIFHIDAFTQIRRVGHVDDWFWMILKAAALSHFVLYAVRQRENIRRTIRFSEATRLVSSMGLNCCSLGQAVPTATEEAHVQLREGTLQVSRELREAQEATLRKGVGPHATLHQGLR